ncbi:major facilitator superfamily domain-containing protein [Mycena crocata]|nr:major facilitator superfamily domain-containing protein [Mycena crocata]
MSAQDVSRAASPPLHLFQSQSKQEEKFYVDETAKQAEEPVEYPQGLILGFITLALCLAVFVVALDNTIIATAIPKITDQFQSLDDVGWYGSAYLLTTTAFQLLYGRFYSFLSIKWVFITAISIFELGSLICGVAPNSNTLIVGRAMAGLGAAGIFTGALVIIAHTVPLEKRPIYSGIVGAVYGSASVGGPLIGGAFTDKLTWRWCFYINLPIGAVTLFVMTIFFKDPGGKRKTESMGWAQRINRFDPLGTIVFIPGIVCLLLALQWGGSRYPWSDGRIIALFVLCGVLITAFVGIQIWKQDLATVPPRILKQRSILAGSLFLLSIGASCFILTYFLPLYFQAIRGVSAVKSGIDTLPLVLANTIGQFLAGAMVTLLGFYTPFIVASSILCSVGAGLISTFAVDTGHAHWIGYQVMYGLGFGFGVQQPLMAAQRVLSMEDIPTGTSLVALMQTLGGTLFISVAQNVFTNKLVSGLVSQVPGINPAIVLSAGATSLRTAVDSQYLPAVLSVYNEALVSAYYVSVATACLSLIGALGMEWKSLKSKKLETAME